MPDVTRRTRWTTGLTVRVDTGVELSRMSGRLYVMEVPDQLREGSRRDQIKAYREVAEMALQLVDFQHGTSLAGTKLRFSQKAGCSCGCSPGFLFDGPAIDIYADFTHSAEYRGADGNFHPLGS